MKKKTYKSSRLCPCPTSLVLVINGEKQQFAVEQGPPRPWPCGMGGLMVQIVPNLFKNPLDLQRLDNLYGG